MDAEKIVKITPESIATLLAGARTTAISKQSDARRGEDRWPFAGAVEVWLPDESYGERHVLATLHNLSPHGLAMRCRRPISCDTKISLAIHQPELSCYGHAIVRHCTRAHVGYLIGVEFIAHEDEAAAASSDTSERSV